MNTKLDSVKVHNGWWGSFWDLHFFPVVLPILLVLAVGPLLAVLIVTGDWMFALLASSLIPLAILLVKNPFIALVVWMLVMPWFPFQGIYKYLYFTIYRLLIPIALVVSVLSHLLRIKEFPSIKPIKLGLPGSAMVAFVTMGIVSIFVTGNNWKEIFVLQDRFIVPFTAYGLIRLLGAKSLKLRRLMPVMLFISLAECVIGLVSWFAPQLLPSIWHNKHVGYRIMGTFDQPAAYGCVLLFYLVCLYHDAMNRQREYMRIVEILAFALGVACIFFTFTRGVWLAGILVMLGWLYLYPKTTVLFLAVTVPFMAVLSITLLSPEFAYATSRLSTVGEDGEARLVLANAGKNMFYARPIFGWGFGNYDRYDSRFLERVGETTPTRWQIEKGTSHHTYLTILAEMGIVGFFFYALPVFWWLGFTMKALPRLPSKGFGNRQLLIALWLPVIAHLLLAQDIDMRFFPYVLTLFWVNLAFIANLSESALTSILGKGGEEDAW